MKHCFGDQPFQLISKCFSSKKSNLTLKDELFLKKIPINFSSRKFFDFEPELSNPIGLFGPGLVDLGPLDLRGQPRRGRQEGESRRRSDNQRHSDGQKN